MEKGKFISTQGLSGNRGTIARLQRIVFDANVYIMLGYDEQYIYGERCYEEAIKLLHELGVDYHDALPKQPEPTQYKLEI